VAFLAAPGVAAGSRVHPPGHLGHQRGRTRAREWRHRRRLTQQPMRQPAHHNSPRPAFLGQALPGRPADRVRQRRLHRAAGQGRARGVPRNSDPGIDAQLSTRPWRPPSPSA